MHEQEIEDQIGEIRTSNRFRCLKWTSILLCIASMCLYSIPIVYFISGDVCQFTIQPKTQNLTQFSSQKMSIYLLPIPICLILLQLLGIVAILTEHLLLILIFYVVTILSLLTGNPIVCLHYIVLIIYMKDLDEIECINRTHKEASTISTGVTQNLSSRENRQTGCCDFI